MKSTTIRKPIKVRLTDQRIEDATCRDGLTQDFIWDTQTPGLALRVSPGGRKTFVYQSRLAGKSIRITIGTVGAWSTGDARKRAAVIQTEIDLGRDPRIVKQERRAADLAQQEQNKREKIPALDVWNEYMHTRAHEGAVDKRWSPRTLLDHERLVSPGGKKKTRGRKKGEGDKTQPGPLFALLQHPLAGIDAATVEAWLSRQQHRPTVARFAYVRLRAFLRWCDGRAAYKGQARPEALEAKEVKDLVPPAREPKKDALQRQHLAAWFDAVLKLENPVQAAYLQTVLLTGARREEVARLQWGDVDLRWNTIRIDGKNGERIIPLTRYVRSVLLRLKAMNETPAVLHLDPRAQGDWQPSRWVFPSRSSKSGYIAEPRLAHQRALKLAGLPHVTIHGLRRSFGSLPEWFDIPAGVIPQIQGHAPSATTERHYRVRPVDLLAKWHNEDEAWILEQAGIKQPKDGARKLKSITVA